MFLKAYWGEIYLYLEVMFLKAYWGKIYLYLEVMFLKAYWGEIYLYLEVMFDLYIFSPAQDKLKKRFDVDVCKKWMQHVEDVKSEVCIIYHDSNCDKTQH
jgi:hypothetical protein